MTIVPFKNGALEPSDGVTFRPLRWDDYVSRTATTCPRRSGLSCGRSSSGCFRSRTRELVLLMLGSSLDGKLVNKRFLVLHDHLGGDNGKSTVVKAAELALGSFCMPNGHDAYTLAYKGKRIAVFDDADPRARLDVAKLKSLTGGERMTHFRWSAFVMIACNKGCLPKIDASDDAFLDRMVVVPMRAKFVAAGSCSFDDDPTTQPDTFLIDVRVHENLSDARIAVMHELVDAYRRYVDAGETFGELPAGCLSAIANNPRLEAVNRFVGENVTNELVRRPEQRGNKVLGFLRRDDILRRLRSSAAFSGGPLCNVKPTALKDLVTSVMATRGFRMCAKTTLDGESVYNVFPGRDWSSPSSL